MTQVQKVTNTLVVDNFSGRLTRYINGDINSGFSQYTTSFGYDPFSKPKCLTWLQDQVPITPTDGKGSTLGMYLKPRLESGTTYVYGVFDTGSFSKIQVNDPATQNPNYDTSSLLSTLSVGSVFSYGPSMQFFGNTERVYIGHNTGVTRVDFTGANETSVTSVSSVVSNVPRPSAQFLGKTYWGNGTNLIEIDSTGTVTSYAKLTPGFPAGTYVRDLDVTPDGNYLQIVVSRLNSPILNTATQDTTALSSADSYKFYWNGTDNTYTSYETYNGYTLTSNTAFGPYAYTTGYDIGGMALYSGKEKVVSLPNSNSPNFGAMFSTGNLVGFASTEYIQNSVLGASLMMYGKYDQEQPAGLYRLLKVTSLGDIVQVPACQIVSNLYYGSAASGYLNNKVGNAKLYYTLLGVDGTGTGFRRLYKLNLVAPQGAQGSIMAGVYETQTQLFSKKVLVSEVRIYGEPWIDDNVFKVDLIGSDQSSIAGASYTFSVPNSSTLTVGKDYAWYNPNHSPTYALGLRITNQGSSNYVIHKVEIDYSTGGK